MFLAGMCHITFLGLTRKLSRPHWQRSAKLKGMIGVYYCQSFDFLSSGDLGNSGL